MAIGRSFLNCFGAVAFDWTGADGVSRQGASVSFYQEYDWAEGESSGGLQTAELRELPCGLLSVDVTLNGRD